MSLSGRTLKVVLTLTLSSTLATMGCGGGGVQAGPKSNAPLWVTRGSGAFSGENQEKVFYGVGSVSNNRNPSLSRTTAQNRARAEISKVFETYSASLMKDYQASTSAGDPKASSEEQHVEQAIKTFSANTLNGVEIVDSYIDPNTGELFALARLDLQKFTSNLDKMKELNAKVRDFVRANAEKAHSDLAAEEAKAEARKNGTTADSN